MNNDILHIKSIETIVNALDPEVKNIGEYTNVMNTLEVKATDIEEFCHWNDAHYTRNLVSKTNAYELLILCWQPGHMAPIHNRDNQDCWMYLVQGTIEEILYSHQVLEEGKMNITEEKRSLINKGNNTYINDSIGLHQLQNIGTDKAITIHLYSHPIVTCNTYNEETGFVEAKKLSYYSIDGQLVQN